MKKNIVFAEVSLYQKSSLSRLSIEHAAAIRMPSSLSTAARSIPLSSANSICRKSPTLWVTGRSANWHFSFRLGNGTTTCGNPRIYFTVTIGEKRKMRKGKKKFFDENRLVNHHFGNDRINEPRFPDDWNRFGRTPNLNISTKNTARNRFLILSKSSMVWLLWLQCNSIHTLSN